MVKPVGRLYRVYKHTNRVNGKVYIGLTCQAPERRWQKGAGYAGTLFGNAIRKYGWDAFEHEVIADGLTERDACEMEKRLIAEYKSNDREHGYNLSIGGETTDRITVKSGAENVRAVSVTRIDPQTGERKVYGAVADAVKEMGINHRGICKACRGVAKTYMGYIWEYTDRSFSKPVRCTRGNYPHTKQQKRVEMTEPDGKSRIFESIKAAAACIGTNGATISRYLYGTRQDTTGRKWAFV